MATPERDPPVNSATCDSRFRDVERMAWGARQRARRDHQLLLKLLATSTECHAPSLRTKNSPRLVEVEFFNGLLTSG